MTRLPARYITDFAFLLYEAGRKPVNEEDRRTLFSDGFLAGLSYALRVMKEGLTDPYDWPTTEGTRLEKSR